MLHQPPDELYPTQSEGFFGPGLWFWKEKANFSFLKKNRLFQIAAGCACCIFSYFTTIKYLFSCKV